PPARPPPSTPETTSANPKSPPAPSSGAPPASAPPVSQDRSPSGRGMNPSTLMPRKTGPGKEASMGGSLPEAYAGRPQPARHGSEVGGELTHEAPGSRPGSADQPRLP